MKLLKFSILLAGAAGLALTLQDPGALSASFSLAPLHTALILIGWAVPVALGIVAIVRPPLQAWQAAASLAGFAVVAIRTRIWEGLPRLPDAPLDRQLGMVALLGGLIVSVVAVARPEGGA